MTKKIVWVMTQAQSDLLQETLSDLLQETLRMDAQSNMIDRPLRKRIEQALNHVKWYSEHEYQKKVFENLKIERRAG